MASVEDQKSGSFKHQWARYVARRALEHDLAAARNRLIEATSQGKADIPQLPSLIIDGKESVGELLRKTEKYTGLGFVPPEPGKFKIGIVGAGVSGLFSAMVFDWLNKNVQGLEIDYVSLNFFQFSCLVGRVREPLFLRYLILDVLPYFPLLSKEGS